MIVFINWLRALAAILITNSHYDGIYPIDILANGGLIGDVLFFAVSGFCLYNIRLRFDKWYLKRIARIYPAVIIITAVYLSVGLYTMESISLKNVIKWFVYPTNYHFVASIMILYIPFYICMKIQYIKKRIPHAMAVTLIIWLTVYIFIYDKSTYHIDNVREPMIRFLYFESMLMGALFRAKYEMNKYSNRITNWILMICAFMLYFATKIAFSRIPSISVYQIINQFTILLLLYFIFRSFAGIDIVLERAPAWISKVVTYLSKTTLEIYLIQYGILVPIKSIGWIFPMNWIVMTAVILALSAILHICTLGANKLIDKGMSKLVK